MLRQYLTLQSRRNFIRNTTSTIAAGALLPSLAGCVTHIGPSYRYRLTVEVNVGGEIKASSSVVEVNDVTTQTFDAGSLASDNRKGEATCVDLGDGRILLALLEGMTSWVTSPTLILLKLYGLPINPNDTNILALSDMRGEKTLTPDQMPRLITFRDPKDSTSYIVVDPAFPANTLGRDVNSIVAKIEITDAPVTSGLKRRLTWLHGQSGYLSRQESGNQQDVRVDQISTGV